MLKTLRPGPLRARTTAEEIDAGGVVLGKGVNGEMRFGEWNETGNAAWCRKDVPDRVRNGCEVQLAYQRVEQRLESGKIRQERGRAATRVHSPLEAVGERHRRH